MEKADKKAVCTTIPLLFKNTYKIKAEEDMYLVANVFSSSCGWMINIYKFVWFCLSVLPTFFCNMHIELVVRKIVQTFKN